MFRPVLGKGVPKGKSQQKISASVLWMKVGGLGPSSVLRSGGEMTLLTSDEPLFGSTYSNLSFFLCVCGNDESENREG